MHRPHDSWNNPHGIHKRNEYKYAPKDMHMIILDENIQNSTKLEVIGSTNTEGQINSNIFIF